MDFGLFTDFHVRIGMDQAEAFEESFDQVAVMEDLGIDSVWLAEHHFSPERSVLASPLVIASAIAARTNRIRVGLAVHVLPLTNPLRVAEEAATVDHISKGRFNFGIGRSGLTKYYQGYNVPYPESRPRFLEALQIIMKGWHQDTFSYEGEYHTFHDVTVVPKPFQKPNPPTTVAVAGEDTFPLIGEMGYPIFVSANSPIPQLQERLEQYKQARVKAGYSDPPDITLRIPAYVGEDAERAFTDPKESTIHAIQYAARELISSAANEENRQRLREMAATPYEDIVRQRVMYGTPDAVSDRLRQYQEELGITGVVLEMNYGGQVPYENVVKSARLLAEKVVPQFK
jgi:alkanesulfonate monooxygenase SsuD/methylene tetrahydromethanopterin reductase-like flavin-dependent oxidoreductase (luciferase family)